MSWKVTKLFACYKLLLISTLYLVPRQYDTSSRFLFKGELDPSASTIWRVLAKGIERLTIWDSVFYVSVAKRGLVYEHEWAFGRFWSLMIQYLTPEINNSPLGPTYWYGLTSIIISITSHYLSVLLLMKLTKMIFASRHKNVNKLALITGYLYTISPAGMYLIAGYSEAAFALLTFLGMYFREKKNYIVSGLAFALCCGVRSNGILWGIVFVYDLFPELRKGNWWKAFQVIIGGGIIGLFSLGLQAYPYFLYCPARGEWCHDTIPSIFGFVQSHYWNVGFLRYWTPNNIPNFLFGAPTLYLLWQSGCWYSYPKPMVRIRPYLTVQFIIFVSAIFVYHAQIITRIATCLPMMYWYTAELISSTNLNQVKSGKRIATYFVLWTLSQAVLFAAFLPPA
ncbi:GPI mannosyltransferase 2 [Trichomonascus vanleenenianus]|uniref:GPI-anchor transamidase GPI18 n=1 Tax=Trichomonascus vanleenenianus TaxID=2268995 RepID=UPI003ECA177B